MLVLSQIGKLVVFVILNWPYLALCYFVLQSSETKIKFRFINISGVLFYIGF